MKEILEAVYFGIFGGRMLKKENKYRILHQIIEGKQQTFVFEWNENFDNNKNTKVDFQRNVIDFFLKNELEIEEEMSHSENGAPFFKSNNQFISISHSEQFFAIQLSSIDSVGVDIQVLKSNVHRGRAYFINDFEEKTYEMTDRELHLIWSAKECVYKLKKGEIEHYREGISVVRMGDERVVVELSNEDRVTCPFIVKEKYVLVYNLDGVQFTKS